MVEGCKHKAAAASINWFVSLLKGKTGNDRKQAISLLSNMLDSILRDNCNSCITRTNCHELDAVIKVVSDEGNPVKLSADRQPGPLVMRKEHAKKQRLIRPSNM